MAAELHVAAAVISRPGNEVLIAQRPDHVPHGGLWEFPGGKLESGETAAAGLARELKEELGITVLRAQPLIRVRHRYPHHAVLLDVWDVPEFEGEPHGREGQSISWVPREELVRYRFPEANLPIITAARLPHAYLITPEPGPALRWEPFLRRLDALLAQGIRLVQFRAKSLSEPDYLALGTEVLRQVRRHGGRLLLNAPPRTLELLPADGIHLTSARLAALDVRPVPAGKWLAASCHGLNEVRKAQQVGADFIVASPVRPTESHPGAPVLGWEGLRELTEASTIPVYALGGLGGDDQAKVREMGAQGIAAIRSLWRAPGPGR